MKKSILLPCLAILLFLLLLNCTPKEKSFSPLSRDLINGTRLWTRIAREGDYHHYAYWPNHEGLLPGQAPHGPLHKIFINKSLADALSGPLTQAPAGSIIVKENYNADEQLEKITVMAKITDYNPEINDWFWAAYTPEGEVLAEGSPKGCINCHAGMKNNDYIIVQTINTTKE